METYENGGHAYHATMPTDALARLRDAMRETERFGFEKRARGAAGTGRQGARAACEARDPERRRARIRGAGRGGELHRRPDIHNGSKFIAQGLQTAAGVPLQCDEPADFRTFRIGLFGLDKLGNVNKAVQNLERALAEIATPALAESGRA